MPIKKIDKRFIRPFISEKLIYTPNKDGIIEKGGKNIFFFQVGEKYSLCGISCDDFEMPTKEYKLIAIVDEINGIELDSVIMKQISGVKNTIFSLTKDDCRLLNIPFQNGLQLFPKNLNWVNNSLGVKEETEDVFFSEDNLSTYPISFIDGTLRQITFEISNCKYNQKKDMVILPNGVNVSKSNLADNLFIKVMTDIDGDNISSARFRIFENVFYRIITKHISTCKTNDIIDDNGNIYIELQLYKQQGNASQQMLTKDGLIGIQPSKIKGKKLNDIFQVKLFTPYLTNKTDLRCLDEEDSSSDSFTNLWRKAWEFNL